MQPLFAFEFSDPVVLATISLISTIAIGVLGVVSMVVKDWLDRRRAREAAELAAKERKEAKDAIAAVKQDVVAVKMTGDESARVIEVVSKQTDGMNKTMVEMSEAVGRGKGRDEERKVHESLNAAKAEGVVAGKAEQKDLQIKAAAGPVVPATVSSAKPGEGDGKK